MGQDESNGGIHFHGLAVEGGDKREGIVGTAMGIVGMAGSEFT